MKHPSWEGLTCAALAIFVVYRLFAVGYELASVLVAFAIIYVLGYYKGLEYLWSYVVNNCSRETHAKHSRCLRVVSMYGALFWFVIPFLQPVKRRFEKRHRQIHQTYKDIDKAMMH